MAEQFKCEVSTSPRVSSCHQFKIKVDEAGNTHYFFLHSYLTADIVSAVTRDSCYLKELNE